MITHSAMPHYKPRRNYVYFFSRLLLFLLNKDQIVNSSIQSSFPLSSTYTSDCQSLIQSCPMTNKEEISLFLKQSFIFTKKKPYFSYLHSCIFQPFGWSRLWSRNYTFTIKLKIIDHDDYVFYGCQSVDQLQLNQLTISGR